MKSPASHRAFRHIVILLFTLLSPWALQASDSDTIKAQNLEEPGVGSGQGKAFSCDCVLPNEKRITLGQGKGANITPPSAIGEKRILLHRVDFSDFVGAALSSNTAVTLIAGLNDYYRSMSYGLMGYAPVGSGSVVTDTLRLPEPSSAYDNNFTKLIEATRQVATNAGYAAAGYDFDVVCTGTKPFLVFGAVAYVGGPGVWVGNNNFNVGVLGHELGHNLGLPHASFWFTSDQSVIGPGIRQEYGDLFDSMGVPGGSTSHFNARFKNFLDWIPNADALTVITNGTYRIAAHDHPMASGLRALRIVRNSSLNYWVEFRQAFNNRWVTNGAGLRWAGNDATNTLLLDTTLSTPALRNDSPILIGRTFSDRCIDLHITPLGKGGTTPESLDVVVNRGPFPNNVAPSVAVMASATTVSTGAVVTLQATASDANGDALAYYWDFGDGNFGGNQASIQYAWNSAGEYVARCTVTDMKGATASASVIIRAGTVTTFLVEGQIWKNGAPVEGALVKAGQRSGYSDSDGTYRISRLTAGRQTMTAILEAFNVFNAGFENPVTVGPNATGLDFVALPDSLNSITLVPTGAVWKYLDTGSTPASSWTDLLYDDASWNSGPAKLGYGAGGEATVVNYGPNASNRYITTWFRHRFVVEDTTVIHHLIFRLRRDDGAVVYLNGQEVYRENLPAGTIQTSTRALADIDTSEEQSFFKRLVSSTGLATGTNLLAVEIHQFQTNSTDLSFDLELSGMSDDPGALRPQLSVQRTATNALFSWPAAYNGWLLYTGQKVTPAEDWFRSTAVVIISNGWNNVYQSPSNGSGFYQLRKPGFCVPFQ